MQHHVSIDPSSEPVHWFVLDIAIARQRAVAMVGPAAAELFGPIPHEWILGALVESLEWHAEHEILTHHSVLNACRSWRYVEERMFDSKAGAAAWARVRMSDPTIVDSALATREGATTVPLLELDEVRSFVQAVRARIIDLG